MKRTSSHMTQPTGLSTPIIKSYGGTVRYLDKDWLFSLFLKPFIDHRGWLSNRGYNRIQNQYFGLVVLF